MKNVLITGCSSGIGQATALGLKQLGYRVLATARREADLNSLKEQGLESFPLELANPSSIESLVETVIATTGGSLDALINNAAYALPGAIEDLTRAQLRAQFEVNVLGSIDLIQRIIPIMRRQGYGRIIQVSSILGIVTMPYRGAYCASKYAIESLGDALRMELKNSGIKFILIEPGPVQSQFRQNARRIFNETIAPIAATSVHHLNYQQLYQQQSHEIPFSVDAKAVVKVIKRALESSHPKPRYYLTFPAYFMMWARRLLPTCALDWLMAKLGK